MSAAEVLEQFHRLPKDEQQKVVDQIRLEFDELTPEQLAEFERRAEHLRHNPASGVTWERIREDRRNRRRQSCE